MDRNQLGKRLLIVGIVFAILFTGMGIATLIMGGPDREFVLRHAVLFGFGPALMSLVVGVGLWFLFRETGPAE
ncbi:MAG: hypothetical protein HQL82_10720 [Magnetococcales bacterium]|nr:hypothetical protein [Magnetococcales bacterium]